MGGQYFNRSIITFHRLAFAFAFENSNLNPLAEIFVPGEEVPVNPMFTFENPSADLEDRLINNLREITLLDSTHIAHDVPSPALSEVVAVDDNCRKTYASKESFKGEYIISHQEFS